MLTPRYVGSLCAACISLAACAKPQPEFEQVTWVWVRTYSASYLPGWEFSDFTPVGSIETWWLSGNFKLIYPYEDGYHQHGVHLFVTVEGQLSSPRYYGNLRRFPRELGLTHVVSVRRQHEASNQTPSPTPLSGAIKKAVPYAKWRISRRDFPGPPCPNVDDHHPASGDNYKLLGFLRAAFDTRLTALDAVDSDTLLTESDRAGGSAAVRALIDTARALFREVGSGSVKPEKVV